MQGAQGYRTPVNSNWGILRGVCEFPRVRGIRSRVRSKIQLILTLVNAGTVARVLPLRSASTDMCRAALASIVLTLTLGQNVALLCHAWCYPPQSANSSCAHQLATTFPSVTENESCARVANGSTPFVREEGRLASASDVQYATVVARFQSVPSSSLPAPGLEHAQATALAARPLVLTLRI